MAPDCRQCSRPGFIRNIADCCRPSCLRQHSVGDHFAQGGRIELTAGAIFNTIGSENAPLLQLRTGKNFTWRQKNLFGISADIDTYFRRNIADPLRFTLGGPLRLSASSIDEYRATDDYLVRFGYLRRLASLPTGLGQGLYFTTAYEGGEVWTPEQPAYLRQDFVSGLVAATPLGLITFGGSVGDAGREDVRFSRKTFLSRCVSRRGSLPAGSTGHLSPCLARHAAKSRL